MSTAKQIDEMLSLVRDARGVTDSWESLALGKTKGLEDVFGALDDAVRVLDEEELFDAKFQSGGASRKWQDLQFVSALAALLIARLTLDLEFDERIARRKAAINECSKHSKRDPKSQNSTQWRFIGRTACDLLKALDLTHAAVTTAFVRQFKHDPMIALAAARDIKGMGS
ncbi:MAG: hypothetical protein K8R92_07545 [Planctomycetes bacterium]|nr:hypothetical protein [Planctomycetota bacterium]